MTDTLPEKWTSGLQAACPSTYKYKYKYLAVLAYQAAEDGGKG